MPKNYFQNARQILEKIKILKKQKSSVTSSSLDRQAKEDFQESYTAPQEKRASQNYNTAKPIS